MFSQEEPYVHGNAEHGVDTSRSLAGPRPAFISSLWASDLESPGPHIVPAT